MDTIRAVLMRRDGLTADEAQVRIQEAKELLNLYLDQGNLEDAENICETEFGLEPDYVLELMW